VRTFQSWRACTHVATCINPRKPPRSEEERLRVSCESADSACLLACMTAWPYPRVSCLKAKRGGRAMAWSHLEAELSRVVQWWASRAARSPWVPSRTARARTHVQPPRAVRPRADFVGRDWLAYGWQPLELCTPCEHVRQPPSSESAAHILIPCTLPQCGHEASTDSS